MSNTAKLGTFIASTSQKSIALNPHRIYTVIHKGQAIDQSADTNDIFLAIDAVAADGAAGLDKVLLTPNEACVIGPGYYALNYKCAAGAPVFGLNSEKATASQLAASEVS